MPFVDVNPAWRAFFLAQNLRQAEDFFRLPGVIICGHPDRNVSRVTLGSGPQAVSAFLKKEHRVRWRDRLANAWSGFGFSSKSCREMTMFRLLGKAGINCPEVMAAGEGAGRAFVLIRAVADAVDLRSAVQHLSGKARRRLAAELGTALAKIHAAGFDQPDLYAKHILVQARAGASQFWFLDWQRSRQCGRIPWSVRCRDLAALDATLSDDLGGDSERLLCLRAYLHAAGRRILRTEGLFALVARRIRWYSDRLLRHRYVRELRHAPLRPEEQSLVWLDGEAACVTPQFQADMGARLPGILTLVRSPVGPGATVDCRTVSLVAERSARLVRRREARPWRWLWDWLRRQRPASPELEQAATLFRLQRYGIPLPRLLAVGQSYQAPWRAESFLLTEVTLAQVDLADWLADRQTSDPALRCQVLRQVGVVLQRLHEAGYYLDTIVNPRCVFALRLDGEDAAVVSLFSAEGLRRSRVPRPKWALQDLQRLRVSFSSLCSSMEWQHFLLAYQHKNRVAPPSPAATATGAY